MLEFGIAVAVIATIVIVAAKIYEAKSSHGKQH